MTSMNAGRRAGGVAVVGAGYWGPNLIRNFDSSPMWNLEAIVDRDRERAVAAAGSRPVMVTDDLAAALALPEVEAVAIATPAATHLSIATAALQAGKHVLVEKPLADSVFAGQALVDLARSQGLTLMADHTYCYTPAVRKIRELIDEGALGDILYIDSVRINLGLVQSDVDVFWDLAPHDLAVFDYLLPQGLRPTSVSAHGADPMGAGKACVGYLSMPLEGGAMAHVHVNWLSPTKIRQMVIGGSQRTVVWDDLNPQQRVSVYDRGVDLAIAQDTDRTDAIVSYRLGDTWAPALREHEALAAVVEQFAQSIHTSAAPPTDGESALRVLAILEAASASEKRGGALVDPGMIKADIAV